MPTRTPPPPPGSTLTTPLHPGIRVADDRRDPIHAKHHRMAIIGIGGSGKNTLAELLAQCDGSLPEGVEAFALDSDPDPCGLPPDRLVTLTLPLADHIVENRSEWPTIDALLPRAFKSGKVFRGSMMKRIVTASIILPVYRTRLRQEIRKRVVARLLGIDSADGNALHRQCQVTALIVGSLGGGFGSGCRDEIPALIRSEIRKVHAELSVNIEWHAFTSNVHRDVLPLEWLKRRADANCYAALAEYEAGHRDPSRIPWEHLGVRPFRVPLIDHVRIYDRANESGALLDSDRDMYAMVATTLLTESISRLRDPQGAHLVNVLDASSPPYGTSVAFRLTFPVVPLTKYGVLAAVDEMLAVLLRPIAGPSRVYERVADELLATTGLGDIRDRATRRIARSLPELEVPTSSEGLLAGADILRRRRRQLEGATLPRMDRDAAEFVAEVGKEVQDAVDRACDELLRTPSLHGVREIVAALDRLLERIDESLQDVQSRLSKVDRQSLGTRVSRSVADVQAVAESRNVFGRPRARRIRQSMAEAAKVFSHYATSCQRQTILSAAASVTSLARARLADRRERTRRLARVGHEVHVTVREARDGVLERIGISDAFTRHVVDADWAREHVSDILDDLFDWNETLDAIVGPELPELDSSERFEDFLNGPCATALQARLAPVLSTFHVLSEHTSVSARAWLRQILERAVPQCSYSRASSGEHCETHFVRMLACPSRADAEILLREHPAEHVEVIETGDPYQLVFTAQRHLVPIHAAISNLGELEQEYDHWVDATKEDPQREVHANRFYAETPLPRLSARRSRGGAAD